jgi:uncharacterized protein with HEPN domain
MSRSATDLLRHMLVEADYLMAEARLMSKDQFLADETRQRAFVRSIEIIGEATKGVPKSFRAKYPEVPWQVIAGIRDRLIHAYFAVDFEIVWDVIENKIPQLRNQIQKILDTEPSS